MIRLLRDLIEKSKGVEQSKLVIRGPLGIWTFPLLNTLVLVVQLLVQFQVKETGRPRAKTYNIVRDEHGRIVSIEEVWIE